MKFLILTLIFLSCMVQLFAQFEPTHTGEIIKHTYYSLSYIEKYEQPEWVFYSIQKGDVERTNDFRPDPDVKTGSASLADYKGSGYDRGHLCPAAAMKVNRTAMSETFYLSNMSPQEPYFNRGIWKKLEALIRGWGWNHTIYVVTGPVFKDIKGYIGKNNVAVPGSYYKVVYEPEKGKMIGFLLQNEKSGMELSTFVVPVDSIESITGIDFFSQLDDSIENFLEKQKGSISSFEK